MEGFVHAELSWVGTPSDVGVHVRRMVDAVGGHPWASTTFDSFTTGSLHGVLAVQRVREPDPGGAAQERVPDLHVVADLQLHSRDALASSLAIPTSLSRSLTDDGLLVRAYRRWGAACVEHLVGDGVFLLWDAARQRLLGWRDPAGVRPLYYHHVPGRRLVLSSDLQSIAAHPEVPERLDLAYTRAFLADERFQHPSRTMIAGVRKLPAAHALTLDDAGFRIARYWDPGGVERREKRDDHDYVEELRELLHLAIADRIAVDGDGVGAHLSGGLDSSSVALLTAKVLGDAGKQPTGFSWAPWRDDVPEVAGDERDLVDAASRFGGVPMRFTRLRPTHVVDIAYRDTALRPRATLNFEVATSRDAVDVGVRRLLSGWGGDELVAFNGRGYFADLARHGRLPTVHRELRSRSRIHGGSLRGAWKARVFLPLLPDLPGRRNVTPPLTTELRREFAELLAAVEPLEHPFPRERPGVRRMQRRLLDHGHLQFRMESWAAHGAALGLTYAFPLLDRRIMEFALSIPDRMYFTDGWKRWLYRTAMDGILPDVVRWNREKFDNAAGYQLRRVLLEPADVYREPLLERRDNPLVDVSVLLAEQDRQQRLRPSVDSTEPVPSTTPIGRGTWLAFTRLTPG